MTSKADVRRMELAERFKKHVEDTKEKSKKRKYWALSKDLVRDVCPVLGLSSSEVNRFWGDAYDYDDPLESYKRTHPGPLDHVFVYPKPVPQKRLLDFLLSEDAFQSSDILKKWISSRHSLRLSDPSGNMVVSGELPWLLFRIPSKRTFVLKAFSSNHQNTQRPRIVIPAHIGKYPTLEILDSKTMIKEIAELCS